MTSRTFRAFASCIAFSAAATVSGCGSSTNEPVAANGGATPPNAPKSQQDHYDQLKAQAKAGKQAPRPTR